jgi:hypothetical protein
LVDVEDAEVGALFDRVVMLLTMSQAAGPTPTSRGPR